ncbi:helix-turn-helix transcriptional regulator [Natroniella sp. ANB-PHB2]|uniref:helix-turn-helix transcriptional regulator n=1 Tax=Natroniella sp. ANB-PHB2 TaxID=3384444 RepID=UPI0038D4BD6D
MPARELLISKRKSRNWSQNDIAQRLGTSQQSISPIENGRRDPTIRLAKKFELLFDEPMESLFPDIFLGIKTTKCNVKIGNS